MITKLPKRITPCPIVESVIEIRFDAAVDADAIFGIIYDRVRDKFSNTIKLPILLIPAEFRSKDPDLQYQPYYRLTKDNFSIQIGPKIFSVLCTKEYLGWSDFFARIREYFHLVQQLNIVKTVRRLGLRYINLFETDIFEHISLQIIKENQPFPCVEKLLKVKIPSDPFISTLSITNKAKITLGGDKKEERIGSVVDIDIGLEKNLESFFDSMDTVLEDIHQNEKRLFFDLLKPQFLDSLNPEY